MHCCSKFVAIAFLSTSALAQTVPAALQPPGSPTKVGSFHASGVQIYGCDPSGTWTLKAPEAELTTDDDARIIHHSAGPTWAAKDGSEVVGRLVAKVPAPSTGAIPWLLVAATPSGSGLLADVHWVQRLDTIGGVAPTGGCTAGADRRVPYKAVSTFYR